MSADCRLTVTVRESRDEREVEDAKELRVHVFCEEQGVDPGEELDDLDEEATHVLGLDESGLIATCRLRFPEGNCKLERMAVESRLRGLGVGRRLLAGAEAIARERGAATMVLNAQTRARDFYAANGYVSEGELFMEAGIEHVRMTKPLPAADGP